MPNYIRKFFSRNKTSLTKTRQADNAVHNSAGAAAAACCYMRAAEETADFAMTAGSNNMGSTTPIQDPSSFATPAMGAMLGVTGGLIGAELILSRRIYQDMAGKVHDLQTELTKNSLKLSKAPLGQEQLYKAYERYLEGQLKKVNYEKFWSGQSAPAFSTLFFIGQFINPLGTLALFTLAAAGTRHTLNRLDVRKDILASLAQAQKETESSDDAIHRQEATIRVAYYKKQLHIINGNALSWGGYSVGMGLLAVAQLGAWGVSLMVPAALPIAALSTLGGGILGTVIYNNLYTEKTITMVPKYLSEAMAKEELPSPEVIRKHIIAADSKCKAVEDYAKTYWQHRTSRENITASLREGAQHTGAFLTLGFVTSISKDLNFSNKIHATRTPPASLDRHRLEVLRKLQKLENIEREAGKELPELTLTEEGSPLHRFLTLLQQSEHRGGIAKMLARRILKEKKGELSYKRAYGSFFDFDEENMQDLRSLHGLQICCNGNWEGGELFERLEKHFSRPEASDAQAEQLLIMLKEVTDHYLLYLAPKAEEQKLSIWAQMSDAFSTVATKQPKLAIATSTPRIEQHISLPSPVQSSENRGTWSKKLSSQRVSTARQEEESSYYAPPLPATTTTLPSKQEAQILARHIFETQSVPEGYIAFQPILSRRLKNGSMHIIYQDPFDASSDKHIHYLIDKEGKFTIQHGNAAQAIIPVTQHTEHKETGIAIHTICNGHYERQPIARYGTGESLLQGVSLVPKKAATLPPSSQWQAYVSQAQARPSQMMLH